MDFSTTYHRLKKTVKSKASLATRARQFLLLGTVVLLGACSSEGEQDIGKVGYVQGFLGGVAIDEPRAALIGRDVLSAGGTAADAVTAMYFAASVTMPATASLGGGGVCIIHEEKSETTEVLDFLPRAPQAIQQNAERPTAVPMNARGFFLLQSKYGDLRWAELVAPAENLARFGTPVSRALAAELNPLSGALIRDPEAARVFKKTDGSPVREGDVIKQFDLAATLTEIRTKGPGAFFVGPFATRFVAAVNRAGGSLTQQDLRAALPQWREPVASLPYEYKIAYFAPPAAAGGVVGAQIWSMLAEYDDFEDADEVLKSHLLAEFAMRAYGDRARWVLPNGQSKVDVGALVTKERIEALMQGFSPLRHQPAQSLPQAPVQTPETPSALSIAAVDRFGSAVACNVTMNNPFGVGRIAPETGVLMAALPGINGRGPMPLGPMLVVNPNSNQVYFAGAASRGVTAPTQLVNVAARIIMAEQDASEAIKAPRTHHGGFPDKLFHEANVPTADLIRLKNMGYELSPVQGLGIVNAIACPLGIPTAPASCRVINEPRAYGLGIGTN